MGARSKGIALVTRPTRLAGLKQRWGTARQARFVLAQAHAHEQVRRAPAAPRAAPAAVQAEAAEAEFAQAAFADYEAEHATYQAVLERLERDLDFDLPVYTVERSFLPNFDFGVCAVVVVVGQDGLVANTAKYAGALPIVGVNPDPARFDGILLPFRAEQAQAAVRRVLGGRAALRDVTLAEARLNDGQRMLAFNDLFLGAASHVSARYTLELAGHREPQSSSGLLVSTGAGSTGWLSSVFNMARGVGRLLGGQTPDPPRLDWEDRELLWTVREPFVSRHSQAGLVAGRLAEGQELIVESLMPEGGVIFSDGVEADFLAFNSGTIARIGVSPQRSRLVMP